MPSQSTLLLPTEKTPDLTLKLVGGGDFDLSSTIPETLTMLVFYRGLHCPICKGYLNDLDSKLEEFESLGVKAVAISSDPQDRAEKAKADWGINQLPIAYGFDPADGRKWGLYISESIAEKETPSFVEPGVFLIQPDQSLYAASIQTMPFARPHFDEILGAVKFITKNNYPARGDA